MRLDKFVSQCSDLSRKGVKIALHNRRIRVDGRHDVRAKQILNGTERVTLDDQPLTLPGPRYLMLHKPVGVVSATRDPEHPCVLDLLPRSLAKGLQIVGRLDKDTTGLLLLTDDGDWNHRLSSPRRGCDKVYDVTTADPIVEADIDAFARGLTLNDDPTPTRPARLVPQGSHRARVTLREGRYHQVKRMFAARGNRVTALHRVAIGALTLDPQLAPGDYRSLTEDEILHAGQ